ncbi:MAG: HEAT repeat domain-containing protein [Gemmatimonadota bacterium]|nr:HEAT repeat domain-containing protein [Gemmatimonadota bacterium]MDH5804301.1 HEAT repeat domain-containing protein [Gemmatimonadota bacterium]
MLVRSMIVLVAVTVGTAGANGMQRYDDEAVVHRAAREVESSRTTLALAALEARSQSAALSSRRAEVRMAMARLQAMFPQADARAGSQASWSPSRESYEMFFPQDDADALYRQARGSFNQRNYREAVDLFRAVRERYPESRYVPQAMYYEAFSLYRLGNDESLESAVRVLNDRRQMFPDDTDEQLLSLHARVQAALAQRGNRDAAREMAVLAEELRALERTTRVQDREREADIRVQAIQALMHMDAEVAVPVLRDVLQNRDPGREHLREQAIFVLSQKRSDEVEEIMLDVVRNDPVLNVREQAVFWLSQVRSESAVAALESILMESDEPTLQQHAIAALAQHRDERAGELLRQYLSRTDLEPELRNQAIHWVGQRRGSSEFLRELYFTLEDREAKQSILMSMSQGSRSAGNSEFLLRVLRDSEEDVELRKQALFWVMQMRDVDLDLGQLYEEFQDREIRQQLMMAAGQRPNDDGAIEFLIGVARNEEDPEVRNQAIFWLGQTRNPRAVEALREIINR